MSWDDEASSWDDNPAVVAYAQAAFASLQEHLSSVGATLRGGRVLDFGCGTGLLTVDLAREAREVVGVDVSAPMIERLRGKGVPNIRSFVGRVQDLELGHFDLVTASSVCAFVDDYPATTRALASLLVPGGWFVQWDWELDPMEEEPYGLTRDAIGDSLRGAGLDEVDVRTAFEVPFEGMVMRPVMGVGRRAP